MTQDSVDVNRRKTQAIGDVGLRGWKFEYFICREPPVPYATNQFHNKFCYSTWSTAVTNRGGSVVDCPKVVRHP